MLRQCTLHIFLGQEIYDWCSLGGVRSHRDTGAFIIAHGGLLERRHIEK